jgi:membrane protease YdiL (CAAX protease family)
MRDPASQPPPNAMRPANGGPAMADSQDAPQPWRMQDPELMSLRTGRWRWPWALLGTAIIGAGAVAIMMAGDNLGLAESEAPENEILIAGRPLTFLSMLVFAAALILPAAFAVRVIHGTSVRALLGPDGAFAWRLFAKAAAASTLLAIVGLSIEGWRAPEQFALQPHPSSHVLWLLLGAAVIVPQAFAEDFVFKGYLLRAWGAVLPIRTLITVLIAAMFTSLHAVNDDLKADLYFGMIVFFATELVAIAVYLRTWSLAATTGLHWANNLFALVLVARPPGYSSTFPPLVYTDAVLAAGGSRLLDPWAYAEAIAGIALLWGLLTWRLSPFHLPKADPASGEVMPTAAPPAQNDHPAA